MTRRPPADSEDPRWMHAVAHPLRTRLLGALEAEPASPVTLARRLGQSLGTVSYHVRVLADLGLLELIDTRQRRGATEHIYKLKHAPLAPLRSSSPNAARAPISDLLKDTHRHASRSAAAGGFDRAEARFDRQRLQLDHHAWAQLAAASQQWLAQATRIAHDASERIAQDPTDAIDAALVLMLFQALPFSASEPVDGSPTSRSEM